MTILNLLTKSIWHIMSQATYQATSYSSIICRPNSLNKNIQQTKQRHFYAPAYIIDAVRLLKCCKEFIRVGEEVYIVITILIVKMVVAEFIQAWWMQMQPDWKSSSTPTLIGISILALNSFSTFLLRWSLSQTIHEALNQGKAPLKLASSSFLTFSQVRNASTWIWKCFEL